ncbi:MULTISPECIES: hypothetical protein [Arcicella]|uniref:6-phosphogluconate dehydrogenase n=1 Tax=Arcicella aquatica TaxID=217141 RepID=A0ABU5QQK9_9BACT|nr:MULTISPECIES: hypothetical protein [Arcicella]MDR6562999.1 hypothetical protein [Arcicella sp. BE51]MDR6813083.1 hypothetical protein [Arcicella sp. BE140]MDR6824397.1 hypothetical protein [Arcicella sp. BE139]MEA5258696.1 hypothetical protein [Arcicella aquatica]
MAFNERMNSAKQATMVFFRRLFIGILTLAVLVIMFSFLLTRVAYSEGERAGVISKFSKKGVVFKTYEGELNEGAQGQMGNMVNRLWAFTVDADDPTIIQKLEDAMLTGRRIRVHYEQRYMKFSWMGDTEYFVDKVDEAPLK